MENKLTIDKTFQNLKELVSLYGEITNKLLSELETCNKRYKELQKENEKLQEKNQKLQEEITNKNDSLIKEMARLKEEKRQMTDEKQTEYINEMHKVFLEFKSLLDEKTEKIPLKEKEENDNGQNLAGEFDIKDL